MRIAIIGAGIIGASLAFHLARSGASVTVLEAARPAAGASGHGFGWINAGFFLSDAHFHLRLAALNAWRQQERLIAAPSPSWQGALCFEDEGAGLDALQGDLTRLGAGAQVLEGAALAALVPALASPPRRALYFPQDGSVDAAAMTRALLSASGARVLAGTPVRSLIEAGGRVSGLRIPMGPIAADHVIVAAGTGSAALLAPLGLALPLQTQPGLILHSEPVRFRLGPVLAAPSLLVRQAPDGGLITGLGGTDAAAALDLLRALFGDPSITTRQALTGWRPVPADGLPAVGQVLPGLSLAVMHSGVTLAALIGQALAAEVMGQGPEPLLAPFRPGRFHTLKEAEHGGG